MFDVNEIWSKWQSSSNLFESTMAFFETQKKTFENFENVDVKNTKEYAEIEAIMKRMSEDAINLASLTTQFTLKAATGKLTKKD